MIISFDIGGTAIRGAVVHSVTSVMPIGRSPTPRDDFTVFVNCLREMVARGGEEPDCVAISIAGVLDPETRIATCANIPCIHGRRLIADLEEALDLPVFVANDADCFTLAEATIGAGKGYSIVFGAILGTGVGGGLVADGRLVNAHGGFAGEWGHGPAATFLAGNPPVAVPAFKCGCGLEGCLDAVGSARGLERLHEFFHKRMLAAEEIIERWQHGNGDAARTIDVFADVLSMLLAMVVNVTGATIVPVGGGLSNAGRLLEEIDTRVRKRVLRRFNRPLVVRGTCPIEPGLMGAALLGLDAMKSGRKLERTVSG